VLSLLFRFIFAPFIQSSFYLKCKNSRDTMILYFLELKYEALFYCTFIPTVPPKRLCVIGVHAAHFDSQSVNSLYPPVFLPLPQSALINYSGNISSRNKGQKIELCCKGGKKLQTSNRWIMISSHLN
jgi:hypothetical protein